jgi:very-short-patch-repair endonuclease
MSDELRDSKLIENGYKVYRIKWKSAVNDTVYIAEEIKKMLEYMASLED